MNFSNSRSSRSRSDLALRLGSKRGRILATVITDPEWPNMYRMRPHRLLTEF